MKFIKWFRIHCCCLFLVIMIAGNSFAITLIEEKKLAKQFMAMINQRQMLLEDPIATHMVNQVGRHLLLRIKNQPFDYHFYVVNADVFNAFAGPGANIFFYRGLITSLDSIDEFAGIVGHEIAHSASRHVSESIDRSKYVNMGSLAGMLAGLIIGTQTSGDAGTAIVKSSIALSTTVMLAFTRENETEADQKGIMFLKQSCFAPEGLMGGLKKIRDADFRGVEAIPEYVKTHPGTGNRIAHTEAILAGYQPPKDKPVCHTDFRFDMVKHRLLGLYAALDPTFKRLITQEKDGISSAALHYGLGFLYERKFMPDKAMAHFKKALSINIFDPMILLEMGRLHLANGSHQKALQTLNGLDSDPVIGVMARFHQAEAQLELRELSAAKNGFDFVINKASAAYPQAYLKLANIYSLEQNHGLSAYNLGLYNFKIGRKKTAAVHLKRALEALKDEHKKEKAKALLDKLNKDRIKAARQKQG